MKIFLCLFFFTITSVSLVFAADPPTENQGANAIAAKISDESNGFLRLVKFMKTNGQKSIVNGIDKYTMECTAEVVAIQNCAMTGFEFGGGWNGSFHALKAEKQTGGLSMFNSAGAGYGTNKQLTKGAHMNFNLSLVFDLTERGWRTEGRLPPDVPFKPADNAEKDDPSANRPNNEYRKLLIGKWQNSRHLIEYMSDGTFTMDGIALPDRKWKLEGTRLIEGTSEYEITLINDKERIFKDLQTDKEYHSVRVK